ncbi:hypothetical protein ACIBCT_38785 [Streptosporangium sp. NPDC050855]
MNGSAVVLTEALDTYGCGETITLYDGEWFHVFNPALVGADDHDAAP